MRHLAPFRILLIFAAVIAVPALAQSQSKLDYKVFMTRSGGFSGLIESWNMDSHGNASRDMLFPSDTAGTHKSVKLGQRFADSLGRFLVANERALRVHLDYGKGDFQTQIQVEWPGKDGVREGTTYVWPYLDPPIAAPKALDSLYQFMLAIQSRVSKTD